MGSWSIFKRGGSGISGLISFWLILGFYFIWWRTYGDFFWFVDACRIFDDIDTFLSLIYELRLRINPPNKSWIAPGSSIYFPKNV